MLFQKLLVIAEIHNAHTQCVYSTEFVARGERRLACDRASQIRFQRLRTPPEENALPRWQERRGEGCTEAR